MTWQVIVQASAEKELGRLPDRDLARGVRELHKLAEGPDHPQAKKLAGLPGYRLRVGTYRILFEVEKATRRITVYAIRHRREAYRR